MLMMKRRKIKFLTVSVLISASLACQPNRSILNSGKSDNSTSTTNSAERPQDTFEAALRGVEKSGFRFIFVIRRKDNGKFTKEDKTYVRANSPAETNQFVLTDEERVIIAGSNYPFPEENLELLRKIFSVEDLSPEVEPNANGNTNSEQTEILNGETSQNSNK